MSRSTLRFSVLAGLAPAALLLASCGPKPATTGGSAPPSAPVVQPPTLASPPSADVVKLFSTPRKPTGPLRFQIISNAISPFWTPMTVGMNARAKELGVTAQWAGPQKMEAGLQRQLLEDAVSKGVDGIAVSCIDGQTMQPVIDELMMRGKPPIPIICIDSDSPTSKRLAYIGTNNFKAGQQAGEEAAKYLPKGGKVVAFVGSQSGEGARQRINGFKYAGASHNIEVVEVLEDQSDKTKARKNVEDAINRYGDKVQAFLGIYSYNGPAIVAAVQGMDKASQYKTFTFDLEPSTVTALRKKQLDFAIVQSPYQFGYQAIGLLTAINRKGYPAAAAEMKLPANAVVDTGATIVTPANVEPFLAGLAKLGIKSS